MTTCLFHNHGPAWWKADIILNQALNGYRFIGITTVCYVYGTYQQYNGNGLNDEVHYECDEVHYECLPKNTKEML